MGAEEEPAKGVETSRRGPPGTSCPVPMPLLLEQETRAAFSVSLKDVGHLLGSGVLSMGSAFAVGLTPLRWSRGRENSIPGIWVLGEVFLPLGQSGLSS